MSATESFVWPGQGSRECEVVEFDEHIHVFPLHLDLRGDVECVLGGRGQGEDAIEPDVCRLLHGLKMNLGLIFYQYSEKAKQRKGVLQQRWTVSVFCMPLSGHTSRSTY